MRFPSRLSPARSVGRLALLLTLAIALLALPRTSANAMNPPTAPTNLSALVAGNGNTRISWNAATDDGAIRTYEIHRNGNWAGWTYAGNRAWTDNSAGPGSTNTYTVYAIDDTGTAGPFSAPITFTNGQGGGNQPPSAPTNLSALVAGNGNTRISWNAATDDGTIRTYEIHRNGNWAGWTYAGNRAWTDNSAGPGTTNTYTVYAIDNEGEAGPFSSPLTFTNSNNNNTAPTAPTNLTALVNGAGRTRISWNAATDDGSIRTYEIHRDGSWVGWTYGSSRAWTDFNAGPGSTHTYTVYAVDNTSLDGPFSAPLTFTNPGGGQTAHMIAVGDLARCGGQHFRIADLLAGNNATYAALGDIAYPDGSAADFANCYDPEFGPYKDRTRPTPGNHEYHTPGAAGYYDYYGALAGDPTKGWYSYDLGAWHVIVLNSECWQVGGCGVNDPMYQWLVADLAANGTQCMMAYSHRAMYSTQVGAEVDNMDYLDPFWDLMQANGVDLYMGGHFHTYERYARMDSDGNVDPTGIRSFVIGGGGHSLKPYTAAIPGREKAIEAFGALDLNLRPDGYDWEFLRTGGNEQGSDSGSDTC